MVFSCNSLYEHACARKYINTHITRLHSCIFQTRTWLQKHGFW